MCCGLSEIRDCWRTSWALCVVFFEQILSRTCNRKLVTIQPRSTIAPTSGPTTQTSQRCPRGNCRFYRHLKTVHER